MSTTGRRELVLLLVGCDAMGQPNDSVAGITRLQKLLFLLEKEARVVPDGDGFEFIPYKAGPYSSTLYDDLELLENLGFLEGTVVAEATGEEAAEVDRLNFEDLMGDGDADSHPDAYEERQFCLTRQGREVVESLLNDGTLSAAVEGIRTIKSKYAHYSLLDLLQYVYTKYPGMTQASEILDKVRRHRGRR